jgi:hypothetical protein
MEQEPEIYICQYCGTKYRALGGNAKGHCVQCFACKQYKPLLAMYGRVAGKGYCCQACETAAHWSTRFVFDVVLNGVPV